MPKVRIEDELSPSSLEKPGPPQGRRSEGITDLRPHLHRSRLTPYSLYGKIFAKIPIAQYGEGNGARIMGRRKQFYPIYFKGRYIGRADQESRTIILTRVRRNRFTRARSPEGWLLPRLHVFTMDIEAIQIEEITGTTWGIDIRTARDAADRFDLDNRVVVIPDRFWSKVGVPV